MIEKPNSVTPACISSLEELARTMKAAQDPWWIIGSAAVALHGGDPGAIADIDVIVSRRDLDALYERLPLTATPDNSKDFFLSERFGRWTQPALEIEFMASLSVQVEGVWHKVEPRTREVIEVGGQALPVPSRAELAAILTLFGREKDLRRAATLAP